MHYTTQTEYTKAMYNPLIIINNPCTCPVFLLIEHATLNKQEQGLTDSYSLNFIRKSPNIAWNQYNQLTQTSIQHITYYTSSVTTRNRHANQIHQEQYIIS